MLNDPISIEAENNNKIQGNLGQLKNSIEELETVINDLTQRISPVLVQESTQILNAGEDLVKECNSELYCQVNDIKSRVHRLICMVIETKERVQL